MSDPSPVDHKDDTSCTNEMSLPDASLVTTNILEVMTSDKGSSLADVIFITSDSVRIPAVRLLLSISSSYFQMLFSSEFAEKNLSEVPISISSSLLQEILEFIYTEDCNRLRTMRKSLKESATISCKEVQGIVELADAADYTCVERLVSRCEEGVRCVMTRAPHTTCAALRALAQGRLTWGKRLLQEAVKITVRKMEESLLVKYDGCDLTCGLMHLDAQEAEDAFSSVETEEREQDQLFQAVVVWASGATALLRQREHPSRPEIGIFIDTDSITIMEDRLEPAKRIAERFNISRFNPGFLANIVEASGLVGHDSLRAAYKYQSTRLEETATRLEETATRLEETVKNKDETISTTVEELKRVKTELVVKSTQLNKVRTELKVTVGEVGLTKTDLARKLKELKKVRKELANKLEEVKKVREYLEQRKYGILGQPQNPLYDKVR